MPEDDRPAALRIIDANLNRLREGLRVVEEYARFAVADEALAGRLKLLRHAVRDLESALGRKNLLLSRDTSTDPFAAEARPEELRRGSVGDVCIASFRRAQEAARVIEEYVKVTDAVSAGRTAKSIRFELYDVEKGMAEHLEHGED